MIDWINAHQFIVMGMVWMLVLGPAVGNYACSVIYRLPRGMTPFDRHPFCGHCGSDLKPRDLFPIFSWLSTRGRCRYCRGAVPGIYTLVEVLCGIIFMAYFLEFGVGEYFLLAASYGVFVIILACIQWQQGWVSSSVLAYALMCVALLRTLQEGTIYGWVSGFVIMLALTLTWQRLVSTLTRRDFRPFDAPWIWWMVVMGTLTPLSHWRLLLVPLVLLALFRGAHAAARPWALWPVLAIALALPAIL